VRKKMGILAMKIWLQDFLPEMPERTARNLMYYTLSLPVATAVIGSSKPEYLEENARLAKAFPACRRDAETGRGALQAQDGGSHFPRPHGRVACRRFGTGLVRRQPVERSSASRRNRLKSSGVSGRREQRFRSRDSGPAERDRSFDAL
jgi:hypothetical protein